MFINIKFWLGAGFTLLVSHFDVLSFLMFSNDVLSFPYSLLISYPLFFCFFVLFHFVVPMRQCLGNHSCTSFTFHIAILNCTCCICLHLLHLFTSVAFVYICCICLHYCCLAGACACARLGPHIGWHRRWSEASGTTTGRTFSASGSSSARWSLGTCATDMKCTLSDGTG